MPLMRTTPVTAVGGAMSSVGAATSGKVAEPALVGSSTPRLITLSIRADWGALSTRAAVVVKDGIYGARSGEPRRRVEGRCPLRQPHRGARRGRPGRRQGRHPRHIGDRFGTGSKAVALSGNRIAVLDASGQVVVNDDGGAWVAGTGTGSKAVALSGNRIAVPTPAPVVVNDDLAAHGSPVRHRVQGHRLVRQPDRGARLQRPGGRQGRHLRRMGSGARRRVQGRRLVRQPDRGARLQRTGRRHDGIYGAWVQGAFGVGSALSPVRQPDRVLASWPGRRQGRHLRHMGPGARHWSKAVALANA